MRPRPMPRHRITCSLPAASTVAIESALRQGVADLASGRLVAARQAFEQVRMLAPQHPTALTMLASIAYQHGAAAQGAAYLDQAILALEAAASASGDDAAIVGPLANLLLARGREAEALALLPELDLPLNRLGQDVVAFDDARGRGVARGRETVLICTVPKSASESLWQRLAAGLDLPRTHLGLGLFPACQLLPRRLEAAAAGGLIVKEHIRPTAANLAALRRHGPRRLIVHLRDPRQAMLSWAHFVHDDVGHRPLAPIWRELVPPAAVLAGGIEPVIDWSIDHVLPWFVRFAAEWAAVADAPAAGVAVHFTTFEAFVADADAVIADILRFLAVPVDAYDAERAGHAPAVHWRAGRVDEWRSVLDRAQRRRAAAAVPCRLAERFAWPLR